MARASLRAIMKRGHELARKMEGDYQARLALGLRLAWAEYKEENEVKEIPETSLQTSTFIKLGKFKQSKRNTYHFSIERETKKAVQIKIEKTVNRYKGSKTYTSHEWLPKSQIAVLGDYIAIADWLPKKKGIPTIEIILDLNNHELKEQTGLDFLKVTASDLLKLEQKGLAHIQN